MNRMPTIIQALREQARDRTSPRAVLRTLLVLAVASANALAAQVQAPRLPRPDHIVIVFEENRAYGQIVGQPAARYINELAGRGALFSQSYGVTHPSQPNYLAFFSGSSQGIADNSCPHALTGANLASALIEAGLTFAIYSEDMPVSGFTGCRHLHYERKHNPAVNWQGINVPPAANMPFTHFPTDYTKLPTFSIVVPNQANDMHNGMAAEAIIRGDRWLRANLDAYVRWAQTHNSLLIVTWDEDDGSADNRIATIFVGPMVRRGVYAQRIDHYGVLRTLLEMYGLKPLGVSAASAAIVDVWNTSPQSRTK
jgi:phospholipase C